MAEETVELESGATAAHWAESLQTRGAEVLDRYRSGELTGVPAVTRNTVGAGTATYLATALDAAGLDALVAELVRHAGVEPMADVDEGLEVVRRRSATTSYLFLINHTDRELSARVAGTDLISGREFTGVTTVPAGDVVVLEEAP